MSAYKEHTEPIDLANGISFQLRYLGSTRIFRYRHYYFWLDTPLAVNFFILYRVYPWKCFLIIQVGFVLTYAVMLILHTMTLINCRNVQEFTDLMYVFGIQINEIVKISDIISHDERIRILLDKLSGKWD